MMRQYELVDRVAAYNPDVDEDLLNRAYVYAMQKHGAQRRANGDPYFSHPLEVAAILTDFRLDDASVAVGLLHDTIEDTDATRDEIGRMFGDEIAKLVDGLTKIRRLDLVSREAQQAENLRKLLIAVADDVRVLLVKLADRLHNMRTLGAMPADKRRRIAEETMEIYAPLAGRMGVQSMREELEDLSFQALDPNAHTAIREHLAALDRSAAGDIKGIEADLSRRLGQAGIAAPVRGRRKRPYAIFRKMERKSIGFEQLSDIVGFRIMPATVADCYAALGVMHTSWRMVPGRFKDYVSNPKENGYRSLHTTIVGPDQQRVEIQIRTPDMDRLNEYGIAAHALYKDGLIADRDRLEAESSAYAWLRRTVEHIAEGDAPEEFLENTKLELFRDQVFCFTPKGRLIALPTGATPVDFAFAVHTSVGETCTGARVNGRIAPLSQPLVNGDEVEIIRSPTARPVASWETFVVTGKARAAIRRVTRTNQRLQFVALGRHMLEQRFARAGVAYADELVKAALPRLRQESVEDVLVAVGRGEVSTGSIVHAAAPDARDRGRRKSDATPEEGWFASARASILFRIPGLSRAREPQEEGAAESLAMPIRGLSSDVPVRFASGGAVPGDRIVGIVTAGDGVTIYPIHSPRLATFEDEPDRWVDVRWDVPPGSDQRFPARIRVLAVNAPGTLARVADVIGHSDGNIDNLRMVERKRDFTDMEIDLEVRDLRHLATILAEIRAKPIVSRAERVND